MSSTDKSEIKKKNAVDGNPSQTTEKDTLPPQSPHHHHANNHAHQQQQQQETPAFIPPAAPPRLVHLTDLKDQSALIQCPHCLRYVYTELSRRGNLWEYITIYCVLQGFFPDLLPDNWALILVAALFVLNYFAYTVHKCHSCSQKVATYNKFEKVINITAPAMGIPPHLAYL